MFAKKKQPTAHFIGIGGIGMSALARWFLAKKWRVSGSDLQSSAITRELAKEGIRVKYGHAKNNLPAQTSMVVMSAAIRENNPELQGALWRGLKPLTYPQTLGCLTSVYDTIGVAGSHGKSTTTALMGLTMLQAKKDPNIIVGTNLRELGGKNFRLGKSNWLVLEADEYKRAFHQYRTCLAIVTNIDLEHLDSYPTLKQVQRAFLEFLGRVTPGGAMVLNRDSAPLFGLRTQIEAQAKQHNIKVLWYTLKQKEADDIRKILKISGDHNVSNALAAYTAAVKVLDIAPQAVLKALGSYRGAWRRMDYRGRLKMAGTAKIEVYDDYAHHPTEIRATLQAFRDKHPGAKLICVYEPHQTKRLELLYREFISAFEGSDLLILLPVYGVAGRDKADTTRTSETLARAIQRKYRKQNVEYLSTMKNFPAVLKKLIKKHYPTLPSSVVVMMGAGTIFETTPKLLK